MWNNRTLKAGRTRLHSLRRSLALCVAIGAILPVLGDAQERKVTVLKSGLHTILAGHMLHVIIAEVGATTSSSTVTIEFRDAQDRRRAYTTGTLQRGRPVRLRLAVPTTVPREELSVILKTQSLINGVASEPIVTLEDIDADSFSVVTPGGGCAVPLSEHPTQGGDPLGDCRDWSVTFATSFEAP